LPTQGLHSTPKTLVRLVDITCDSDGELVRFVSKTAFKNRISCKNSDYFTKDGQLLAHPSEVLQINGIPLPEKNTKVGSYVVVALTGAYQDTVQFDQNLLGALPEVEVVIDTLGHTQFKILSYAESNSNLIADMKHNLHTIDALEHLLFSNPYVNNKSPSSTIRPAEILESSKSPQIKQTFTESKQMNVN
jgi:arginine decarboxylase-like protein